MFCVQQVSIEISRMREITFNQDTVWLMIFFSNCPNVPYQSFSENFSIAICCITSSYYRIVLSADDLSSIKTF